jgi:predicted PurR-regulated permease PerM
VIQPETNDTNNNSRQRWSPTIKAIIGVIVFVLVALAIFRFSIVFVPLIIGGIMAYIFQPVVTVMHDRLKVPRGLATALIYLILLGILVPIGISLTPVIIRQIRFLQNELIGFIRYIQALSPDTTVQIMELEIGVKGLIQEVTSELTKAITATAAESITVVLDIAETLLLVIFTLLIAFYLTKDAPRIVVWLGGLVPPGYQRDVKLLLHEIDGIWSAFFRGQLTLALTVTVIMTGISAAIGLPQPVLMGMLAGVLEFLPSVGHTIWIVTAVIIALLEGSSTLPVSNVLFAFILAGVHFGFTQFDLNYLIPRIIGREVHLHPMVVIIGIIIGASLGGVLGIALAAPMIASLRILGRYVYAMLFDLDPFPMVGPPSAPKTIRQSVLKQQAEEAAATPSPEAASIMQRVRRRRTKDEAQHPVTKE